MTCAVRSGRVMKGSGVVVDAGMAEGVPALGKLCVTGAGGWVGQALVRAAQQRGHTVCALAGLRPGQAVPEAAMADAVVVHLAAMAHRRPGTVAADDYRRVNAEWPVQLAKQARRAGARRFVMVSSAAVMGAGSVRPWRESDAPQPVDAYAAGKWQAETQLWPWHEPGRFEVCVVRPPLVWGPGVRANFLAMLRWAVRGWPMPLAGATAPRSMVYLDNLVAALLHLSAAPQAAGHTFFVRDEADWSVSEWITQIRQARACPPRLFKVSPVWMARLAKRMGRRAMYERLFLPAQLQDAALRATGWRPPVTMQQGLRATLAWLESV